MWRRLQSFVTGCIFAIGNREKLTTRCRNKGEEEDDPECAGRGMGPLHRDVEEPDILFTLGETQMFRSPRLPATRPSSTVSRKSEDAPAWNYGGTGCCTNWTSHISLSTCKPQKDKSRQRVEGEPSGLTFLCRSQKSPGAQRDDAAQQRDAPVRQLHGGVVVPKYGEQITWSSGVLL
ncbi:hypothetical protein EYF80_040365 [Liparis tanakae]|uniref:Uncharacterized protein n=1 Tax=Liparis tanakae TaxID=230148 RepID=A0A4Z2G8D7_9TELE|nr:hypothetical protein EYF80_040365 [Liparis tanakae]